MPPSDSAFPFLPSGEASDLVRAIDWQDTDLGVVAAWPVSLRVLLASLMRSSLPSMLLWGPALVQFYNDAYVARVGLKHPLAMGARGPDSWRQVWPKLGPQVLECMRRGVSCRIESERFVQEVDGHARETYYTYGVSPAADETGAIQGVLMSFQDTTARVLRDRRRQAMQTLADSLTEFRPGRTPLAEAAAVLSQFSIDLPWLGFYRFEGTRAGVRQLHVLASPSLDTALRERLAHDATIAQRLRAGQACVLPGLRATSVASTDTPVFDAFVVPLRHADGPPAERFAAYALNPLDEFDDAYRRFCTTLTERIAAAHQRHRADEIRHKVERERNDLLEHAPIATAILVGRELLFTLANPKYLEVVQRRSVVGLTYEQAFPELVDTPLPGILRQAYDSGEPYVSPELPIWLDRSHGRLPPEETFFQFSLQPLRDANQDVYALAAVCVDLTEQVKARRAARELHELDQARLQEHSRLLQLTVEQRTAELRRANEALAQSRDEALSANRQKTAFLANMSHEIRTPLNAIIGLSHLMTKGSVDPTQLGRLSKITDAGHHLLRVINDILDLSKIEAGALVLDARPFRLASVVRDAIAMVGERAREKGLALTSELHDAPDALTGDPTRLSQVLINLLSNAVKFTQAGRVRLTVRELDTDGTRSKLRFEVEDTGPGIAADRQPALFNAFVQADDSLARLHGGTGLGLALCRQLARAMGGDAGVASTPGVGSRFHVDAWLARTAPEDDVDDDAPSAPVAADRLEDRVRALHAGRRVLLAEDNLINRELAVALLQSTGLRVDTAVDGNMAVARTLDQRYDLILMDMQMPELDGLEATRRIRANGDVSVPIVAMTANAFLEDRDACLAAGMNDHLTKPVQPGHLYATILRWLGETPSR